MILGVIAKVDHTSMPVPVLVSEIVTAQTSISVVVTGGIVRVVVCTIDVHPVGADHATSRLVTYGGNLIVVFVESCSGGKMSVHGAMQFTTGPGLS